MYYNCSQATATISLNAKATYYTEWFRATVNGIGYPAANSIIFSEYITVTTYVRKPLVFPGLTVTQLTPGEGITLVYFPPPPENQTFANMKGWTATGPSSFNQDGQYMY